MIDNIYDIKSTLGIKVTAKQLERLKAVLNAADAADPKNITFLTVPERWTAAKKWEINPKYARGIAVLTVLGVALEPAWHVINAAEYDGELEAIAQEAARIRDTANIEDRELDTATWLVDVGKYLSHYFPENTVNLIISLKVRDVLNHLNQFP